MPLIPSISNGFSKMESKLGFGSAANAKNDFSETRSTVSSSDLLPMSYGKQAEPTALRVARLISRTLFGVTAIVALLVMFVVLVQSRNARFCERSITVQHSRNVPFYEPLSSAESRSAESGVVGGKKIPISIQMSGRAGDLMEEAGGKGHVNCLIERKTANQIIASEPKKLFTPFGNITTDPRLIHLTGEKLVFSCHSGPDKEAGIGEKDKDIIIISNSKETFPGPKDEDEEELEEQGNNNNTVANSTTRRQLQLEIDSNSIEDPKPTGIREKRSPSTSSKAPIASFGQKPSKECSCNCTC